MPPNLLLFVFSLNSSDASIGFSLIASPFLVLLARSPDAIDYASTWEATPQSYSRNHQLCASSLLLEMPLSLTSLSSLGGTDTLEKGPAEWNSPF